MELDGKRVLLSGATGGIGQAVAGRMADAGANLILSSRREAELERIAEALPGGAARHDVVVSDLAEQGAAEKLIGDAGDVDALVANAALPASGLLDDFTPTEISRAIRVNLEAPILMAREIGPALARKGQGHIVVVASLSGKVATPRASLYNATKFGLRGFAFGFREDMHPHGVGVSIVSPGFVREAGMFHDSGADPPPGVGTTTPGKCAEAVERAIRRDKVEITVAPRRTRFISEIAYRHPGMAASFQRRSGADEIAKGVADGQTDKR